MTNPLLANDRLVRWLHPLAWWGWALCAATAASSTANPLLLTGIAVSALTVVITRGARAPWAASVTTMLMFAGIIVVVRLVFQALLGAPIGTHVVLRLPAAALPGWLTGVRLGGPVTLESLLLALVEGLRFSAILLSIAAASTVAAPSRLFRALPARAADVGTLLIVAMTLVPHLVQDFRRITAARRLRGRTTRGVRAVAASLTPVIDGAMERSMQLAASMFSRGYGLTGTRTRHRPDPWRPVESAVLLCGVSAAIVVLMLVSGAADGALSIAPLRWPSMPLPAMAAVLLLAAPAIITPGTPATDGQVV